MIRYRNTFIGFFIFCITFLPAYTFALTASDVSNQINDINSQILALDKEIKQYQSQISETNAQSNTLSNLIKELTLTRSKLLKELDLTQKKITATGLVISTLDNDISAREKSIADSQELLKKMFRNLDVYDNATIVEKILSQDSLANASREYNNIATINESIRGYIIDIKKEREIMITSKNQKEVEKKNLSNLKKTLSDKKLAIEVTKKEKDTLLTETKNKESNYKKLLADRQKKRDAFEKDLQNYEAQLKFILNPNLLPTPGSGILSWPLDTVFVTQLFGKTVSAKRLYTSGSHSGVDFRASIGTPVKAMASGTVIGVGDTDIYCKGASFGKWVFIKYNNGLSSTYGHLSVLSTSAGAQVKTGDVVALSGNTGHSTGPHLHVTVYASQGADVKTVPSLSCNGKTFIMPIAPVDAYLDPMLYLPQALKNMVKNDTVRD